MLKLSYIFAGFTLFMISAMASALDVDVKGGHYSSNDLPVNEGGVVFTIAELNDEDPRFAPLTQLLFYKSETEVGLQVAITKVDGPQGLTTFYTVFDNGDVVFKKLVKEELSLGEEYRMVYYHPEEGRLVFGFLDEVFGINLEFDVVRVRHTVSGMKLKNVGPLGFKE